MNGHKTSCECTICKHQLPFEISDELVTEIDKGKVTIFAGAGISTESRLVARTTFYESVAMDIISKNMAHKDQSFPQLMSLYESQPNGRIKLIQKIKDRFDYIDSFPEMKKMSTRFHNELATIFQIKNIITTNWDTNFEDYCGATPFYSDADLAFWDAAERRVLKIHGSITNFGSIVASTSDYTRCQRRLNTGVVGSFLKTLLATQTIIFIGYSLSDTDFDYIYKFVKRQMNGYHRQAYAITPFKEEGEKFRKAGLIPIITDGTYFLSKIKEHPILKMHSLDDGIYDDAHSLLKMAIWEHQILHDKIKAKEHPNIIYTASYQDGLIHALQRAIVRRKTGEYSHTCKAERVFNNYLEIYDKKIESANFVDAAYTAGYINGLAFLKTPSDERKLETVPLYFAFGHDADIYTFEEYTGLLDKIPGMHAEANLLARELSEKLTGTDIEYYHHAWL